MDQNEKLAMFGVTHVLAIDGFSSKIVGSKTMAVKNNLLIYDCVYRPAVLKYGMWDQVRNDHGTEFYLCLYMQERNAAQRSNTARMPYIQSQSKRNHKIERMWPEVNQRVNYPIKAVLVDMVNQDQLDMDDQLVKYCVSSLVTLIAEYGLTRFVHSWNCHRIPGHGIPNNIGSESTRARVGEDAFPSAETSAAMYAQDLGSSLTAYSPYGTDPFSSEEARKLFQDTFNHEIPDLHFFIE